MNRAKNILTLHQKKQLVEWCLLIFMLFGGLIIRVSDFETFQPGDRQFRSAIIARAYYLKAIDSLPESRQQVVEISLQRAGLLEPPIMERMVSIVYRLINRELLWIPKFLSSFFWVFGGYFLYKIIIRVSHSNTALFGVAYYLFVPMGIYISTGFVPDPLMVMLFLMSILMIINYYDRPSNYTFFSAGVVSALAILVKPFCFFAILGVFISLGITRKVNWKVKSNFQLLTFIGFILLPVLYYVNGIFAGGLLLRQSQTSFFPQLLLTRSYWTDWLITATRVAGFTPLIAALVGFSVQKNNNMVMPLLVALWAGYIVFCLTFTYHIRFGPHYHSQLIVIVAISIVPIINLIIENINKCKGNYYWWIPFAIVLGLIVLINFREIKNQNTSESPRESNEIAQEIGEIVNHSTKTVYVAYAYGTPLEYYGELSGIYWPRSISDRDQVLGITHKRSVEERLQMLDYSPEYFIITNFQEYSHHPDLKEYLESNCLLLAKSEAYLIYSECE